MTDQAISTARTSLSPSTRARSIAPSGTMALDAKAKKLKAEGKPIISFGLGEPDFATPGGVKLAAEKALNSDFTHYTAVGGEAPLKKAIAEYTAEISGVPFSENQVIATSGAKEALFLALQAICDPGDEVLLPAPYWVSYAEQARLAGATPVIIQTDPGNWKLTPDLLRAHITPRSKLLLLCTPSNPTGIVYTESELRSLAEVLLETGVGAMVDEIYARISYVPVGRWLRAAPDMADKTLIVDGVSKAYAMTGWRLGWVVGPKDVVDAAIAVQSHSTSHPSSVAQRAAEQALAHDPVVEAEVDKMVRTFRERRDAIVAGLSAVPGVVCPVPEGAFYVYPDVRALLGRPLGKQGFVAQSAVDLADYLLDQAMISAVPGEAFGTPGFMRFSYALSMEELKEGVQRFVEAVA